MQDKAHMVGTLLPIAGGLKEHLFASEIFWVLSSAAEESDFSLLHPYSNTDETSGTQMIFLPPT